MGDEPKRPWWRRKRGWAAGSVLAVAAYLASLGPLAYCEARGWLGPAVAERLRTPADLYSRYVSWWRLRGWDHGGTWPSRPQRQVYYGTPTRGELPLVMPDPDAPSGPADPADLPPPPAP